jgi:hypothetical protein
VWAGIVTLLSGFMTALTGVMVQRVIMGLGRGAPPLKGGVNEDLKLLAVAHALSLGDPYPV